MAWTTQTVAVVILMAATAAEARPPPWGIGISRGEDLAISLVTFGPGDDIAAWFGHSALLVEDRRLRERRVYNYGMFDFGPTLLVQFLSGRLNFWVGESGWASTVWGYRSQSRDIRLQQLNLTPDDSLLLARALADNVLPENRYYLYHHYDDNCATRVRDMIDMAVRGQLREATTVPGRMTLREHTRRHTQHNPYIDLLLDYWMNDEIDRPVTIWDEMFLPAEMERAVDGFTYVDASGSRVPLVADRQVIHVATGRRPVPEVPSTIWPWTLLFGMLLALAGVGATRWHYCRRSRGLRVLRGLYDALIGGLYGLPGLALFFMWTLTEHTVTWRSETVLLANPLTTLLLPLGIVLACGRNGAWRWIRRCWLALGATSLLLLLLGLLPGFDQDTLLPTTLMLPANLAVAWTMWRRPAWT